MIKKLNKDRGVFKRQPWLYYFDKDTDDLSKISHDDLADDEKALLDGLKEMWSL